MTNKRRRTHLTPRGSITSMVLAWWTLTVLSLVAITHTGQQLLVKQRTQHAADSVALAWVAHGSDAGRVVATAYAVAVKKVEDEGSRVRVWVTRGDHIASATAQYTQ